MDLYDQKLGDLLESKPHELIDVAEKALYNLYPRRDINFRPIVRFTNVPNRVKSLRGLRSEQLHRMVSVDGLVKKMSGVIPVLKEAVFECKSCLRVVRVAQETANIVEPSLCPDCQGRGFNLLFEESNYKDLQIITVQEPHEQINGRDQPRQMKVLVNDDMVDSVAPGELVRINGILNAEKKEKSKYMEFYLNGIYLETLAKEFEEVKVTPEDEEEIIELSKDPDIYQKMVDSVAPLIHGFDLFKEAVTLQLFGGSDVDLHDDNITVRSNIHVMIVGDPGIGKALALDTPIPTPEGFTTMGELKVGDTVFDEKGMPCKVVTKSPVFHDHECFKVTFSRGGSVICDAEHLWYAQSRDERRRNKKGSVRTTAEMFENVRVYDGRANYSIPTNGALKMEEVDLPVDPYVLGLWLGDGGKDGNTFTTPDPEVLKSFKEQGYVIRPDKNKGYRYLVSNGLRTTLKEIGLLNNKNIPDIYLRASYQQRMELIRGLMDSDGSIRESGLCEFTNKNKDIVLKLAELLRSVGIKTNVIPTWKRATNGVNKLKQEYWILTFTTDLPVFKLERKKKRLAKKLRPTQKRTYITKIEKVKSVPTQCITVDSPNHLFLCSEYFIPTHNSQVLKYISKLAPGGIYASGKGASGVGLTAALVPDEMGGWTLEAGALVLADKGFVCIDEFDKMREDDRSAIHEALEQGTVTINKASVQATLNSRCSTLAAANPKFGRFDSFKPVGEQLDLPPTLLSRFDLIFVVEDIPDQIHDREVAKHIVSLRNSEEVEFLIEPTLLKKYIAYARQNFRPKMPPSVEKMVVDYYVNMRGLNGEEDQGVSITPRQLEGVIRLASASAKKPFFYRD